MIRPPAYTDWGPLSGAGLGGRIKLCDSSGGAVQRTRPLSPVESFTANRSLSSVGRVCGGHSSSSGLVNTAATAPSTCCNTRIVYYYTTPTLCCALETPRLSLCLGAMTPLTTHPSPTVNVVLFDFPLSQQAAQSLGDLK